MSTPVFKIYIAGHNSRNRELIATLKEVCTELFLSNHQIQVIDILKSPKEAEKQKVLATPMIVRVVPAPEKRIIGDFREAGKATQAINFLTEDINIIKRNAEK